MMKTIHSNRGFTLVELMISISVATIMGIAVLAVSRAGTEQLYTDEVSMTMQESAREGLYKIAQEIRLSAPDRIQITGSGAILTLQIPDPNDPVNVNSSDAVEDYSIEWASALSVQYSLVSGQLIRTDLGTGNTEVMANDVTSISFVGDSASPSTVVVTLGVQRAILNGRLIQSTPLQLSSKVQVRNV